MGIVGCETPQARQAFGGTQPKRRCAFSGLRQARALSFMARSSSMDLWTDLSKSPAALVHEAVRRALGQLQTPGSGLLNRLKGAPIGAASFLIGFPDMASRRSQPFTGGVFLNP